MMEGFPLGMDLSTLIATIFAFAYMYTYFVEAHHIDRWRTFNTAFVASTAFFVILTTLTNETDISTKFTPTVLIILGFLKFLRRQRWEKAKENGEKE